MKSFMMRGVILVALLSLLVLPSSAAWSNTDSNNLATIKTYTSNIYTVLNQSSLGSRLSSIVSNTQNTANYLSTISARIGTSNTWPTINGQLTKIIGQNSDSYTRLGDVRSYLLDIRTTVSNIYTKMGTGGSSADLTTVNNNTNKLVTRADTMVSSLSQIEINTNAAQTYLGYINLKIDDVKSSVVSMDFLSGASAGTSLGKSDFGSLSSVGSLAKDIVSLNGQSSVVSFIDGLNNAEYQGQGWFSEATRSALDAVSTRSFRSVRATPVSDADPYNMHGFSEHYNWLFGGDVLND